MTATIPVPPPPTSVARGHGPSISRGQMVFTVVAILIELTRALTAAVGRNWVPAANATGWPRSLSEVGIDLVVVLLVAMAVCSVAKSTRLISWIGLVLWLIALGVIRGVVTWRHGNHDYPAILSTEVGLLVISLLTACVIAAGLWFLSERTVGVLARRETKAMFFSLIGYVVLAVYLFYAGGLFAAIVLKPGRTAEMQEVFTWSHIALIFIVPVMTMGLFAEEYSSGRMEMLRTSPITEADLVLGKFLGAMAFYLLLIGATLLFVVLLACFARPNWGEVIAGYLGLCLMGFMFVSIGLFFSSITPYQIVAVLLGIIALAFVGILVDVAWWVVTNAMTLPHWAAVWLPATLEYLAFRPHMAEFARGRVETRDIAYFLTGGGLFNLLTYLVLESRKWR